MPANPVFRPTCTCFLLALSAAWSGPATADTAPAAGGADDPFLWMEEIWDERALDWVRQENARSLAILEAVPEFPAMLREAKEILNSQARVPQAQILGEHVFSFWQDAAHVRGLWRRTTLADFRAGTPRWEVLLDVDALAREEDENWVFGADNWNCLGPEYQRCMLRLSRGGSDAAEYREFSVKERGFVSGGFALPEAKSWLDWLDPDTLLVGTDWGPGSLTQSGYPRTVKAWKRGTPLSQARELMSVEAGEMMLVPQVFGSGEDAHPTLARVVTFFEREHYLLGDNGPSRLPLPRRVTVFDVLQGRLILRLDQDWRYREADYAQGAVVALDLSDLAAELVYQPPPGEAVTAVALGAGVVHLEVLDNVIGRVRQARRGEDGWRISSLPLPDNGVVSLQSAGQADDGLLVSFESLTTPDTLFYASGDGQLEQLYALPAFFDASDVVVQQRFATSKDGTRVPYFVMGKKTVLEKGDAPTVQYGYGGFLIPILPNYYEDPSRPQHGALAGRLWVARGGVLVLSNIRGGGEYGPAWHEAALKDNRHRAFEDFFAIGESLVASGLTSPAKLGAIGRSNGGLLMGVALTQRPDLYSAIDCGVPLLDMLRYHRLLAGASWTGEYGDPENSQERSYLASYSPYQALQQDAGYPEVFFYTSTGDDRVHPGHARKMAARLKQWGKPFLYYENIEGGHGGTANQDQLAYRTALEWAYFARRLMNGPAAAQ